MDTFYDYSKENNKEYLLQEWDYDLNVDIDIKTILAGSNKKVWWKCFKCGYKWQARIIDRVKNNNGCPACANKVLFVGHNDLASTYPDIAKEWHPTKNGNLTPKDVKATERKKVWWKCSNRHHYLQRIYLKTIRNCGCPICNNQQILVGYNDLATTYPEIAKEWNYEKNGNFKPEHIAPKSGKKVWWKCSKCGYEWQAVVEKRNKGKCGCPNCGK